MYSWILFRALYLIKPEVLSPLVLDQISHVISDDMNQQLIFNFEEWEVAVALKHRASMKAFGPDGMPPFAYQHFWPMVEGDVTQLVLSWLNSSILPHPVNHTFITLIPKKENP